MTRVHAKAPGGSPPPVPARSPAPGATTPAATPIDAPGTADALGGTPRIDPRVAPPPVRVAGDPAVGALDVFPLHDLGALRPGPAGQAFRLDGGAVDGLRVVARRFVDADGPGVELTLRLTGPSLSRFEDRFLEGDGHLVPLSFDAARTETGPAGAVRTTAGGALALAVSKASPHAAPGTTRGPVEVLEQRGPGWAVQLGTSDSPLVYRGWMRIRARGDDAEATRALQQATRKLGLGGLLAPSMPKTQERYALLRSLWRLDPEAARGLVRPGGADAVPLETIREALTARGFGPERQAGLRFAEVAPGHFTVMDDGLVQEMKAAGLRWAYSTIQEPEHVLAVLRGGQKSTRARWDEGLLVEGLSSTVDAASGGAEGVFTRLVTDKADGMPFLGRRYRVVLRPELYARADAWGWPRDEFGRAHGLGPENFGAKLVDAIHADADGYAIDNEVVLPHGNGPEWIAGVVCEQEAERAALITHLRDAGWAPPDGRSLEQFVRVEPQLSAGALERLLPPKP